MEDILHLTGQSWKLERLIIWCISGIQRAEKTILRHSADVRRIYWLGIMISSHAISGRWLSLIHIYQVKQASAAAYTGVQEELLVQSADLLKDTKEALRALETVVAEVPETEGKEQAFFFMQKVVPAMEALRKPVDELEMIVNKNMWPMPSYGDLLFEV